ncbi:phiSA1p31-related protein [Streptomyces sp. NPDC060001]|uniref:phiSA1p31-related protein n=1 Tax=Streptomyces sp. NPDC060001 TaxID=3347032 RepID=UPI0036C5427D
MTTTFEVGAKVEHRTFGAGEVAFGPFEHSTGQNHYLIKQEGGKHALVVAEALSLSAKFKVGDKVSQYGSTYTIHAGPFRGNAEWYAVEASDGKILHSTERALTLVIEPAKNEPVKVGDRVRVVKDDSMVRVGEFVGKIGIVQRLNSRSSRLPYDVKFDVGQGARHESWNVAEVEKLDDPTTVTHDGITYDLTARYKDRDGDTWALRRDPDDESQVQMQMTPVVSGAWSGYTLGGVVRSYGPLRKI